MLCFVLGFLVHISKILFSTVPFFLFYLTEPAFVAFFFLKNLKLIRLSLKRKSFKMSHLLQIDRSVVCHFEMSTSLLWIHDVRSRWLAKYRLKKFASVNSQTDRDRFRSVQADASVNATDLNLIRFKSRSIWTDQCEHGIIQPIKTLEPSLPMSQTGFIYECKNVYCLVFSGKIFVILSIGRVISWIWLV